MKTPRPYQREAVNAVYEYYRNKNTGNPLIALPTGCHAKDSGIMMYDGSIKKVHEVIVGDKLMGDDSTPRTVLNLARGSQEMVKVIPHKGNDTFVVNTDHILSLKTTKFDNYEKGTVVNLSFSDFNKKANNFKDRVKLYKPEMVNFPNITEPTIDSWVAGLMLGDGSMTCTPILTSMDGCIVDKFTNYVTSLGCTLLVRSKEGNNAKFYHVQGTGDGKYNSNQFTKLLRDNDLWGNIHRDKYVPDVFKYGSIETRLTVLSGLLDSDGHLDVRGTEFDFISVSKQLSEDVTFIARSLGLWASISECQKGCQNDFIGTYWRVNISGDVIKMPVVKNKHFLKERKINKNPLVTGFSYELLADDDFYGFELDGNHLYLDEFFFIHHNTGKAYVISTLLNEIYHKNPNIRITMLVDSQELVEQNYLEAQELNAELPMSIFCSGLNQLVISQITFASIQTASKKAHLFGHIDLVIIDEVQSCDDKENSQYRRFLDDLSQVNPNLRVVGLSATLWRQNCGWLTNGDIFTDVIYDRTMKDKFLYFIDEGYLVDIVSRDTLTKFDLSNVKITAGEFNKKQLIEATNQEEIIQAALIEAVPYIHSRNSVIVFCTGVDTCENVASMLESDFGISSLAIHSKLSDKERKHRLALFKSGEVKCVINDNILTKGFNHKPLDMMIDLSPTASSGRFVQRCGRLTRPMYNEGFDLETSEGRLAAIKSSKKPNALLLDFAGNSFRCGKINDPNVPKKKGEGGNSEPPMKVCPQCLTIHHTSVRVCNTFNDITNKLCDFKFEFNSKLESTASTADIIARPQDPLYQDFEVREIKYSLKKSKKDKIPMLRVTYMCGFSKFDEYICLEHTGFAYTNARKWWRNRTDVEPPATVNEGLLLVDSLTIPTVINVLVNQKYPKIMSYLFDNVEDEV